MNRTVLYSGLMALIVSLTCIGIFSLVNQQRPSVTIEHVNRLPASAAGFIPSADGTPLDFTQTAAMVVDAVVHIKSTQTQTTASNSREERAIPDPFREFFRDRDPRGNGRPRVGTGSGVIINADGYIVTNNHVVGDADDIEVTLYDNRTYKATVIGTDPTTDLAVIQIKEKDLPYLSFIDSDAVQVGEWVLAVGNPFSLNSTVTAGIVSAKGRSINILRERFAVESFIQTDAAINPGNSGGALVNLAGGLVGINTAIASPTGSYSGYGFAVPSNIVNKVVTDLLEFGEVQRGVLGIMIRSVDGNLARQESLKVNDGVYVDSLLDNSAAGTAGVLPGDVIIAIEGSAVKTVSQLQEAIALRRPGDQVKVLVDRNGTEKEVTITLNSRIGKPVVASREVVDVETRLGVEFEPVKQELANELEIQGGVQVAKLKSGKLRRETQIREGFIITKVNGKSVNSVDELESVLSRQKGGIMLEGVYADQPGTHYYAFGN